MGEYYLTLCKAGRAFLAGLCSISLVFALLPSLAYALPEDESEIDGSDTQASQPQSNDSSDQDSVESDDASSGDDAQENVNPDASDSNDAFDSSTQDDTVVPDADPQNVVQPENEGDVNTDSAADAGQDKGVKESTEKKAKLSQSLGSGYNKADFYAPSDEENAQTFAYVDVLDAPYISEEMKYFGQFESGKNYDQGLSYGDGYNAMGYYQFDRRYGLRNFMAACYSYNSNTYKSFGPILRTYSAADFQGKLYTHTSNGFTKFGNALNKAWHDAYRANPNEFSQLQDAFAYNTYYVPNVESYLSSRGIHVNNRADCVKGLLWGMVNLFGSGGWRQFVGGPFNGTNYRGAGLRDSMTDAQFVTTLCDYVVANVSRFYPSQSMYWEGWQNRYRNEKKICLSFLNDKKQLVGEPGSYRLKLPNGKYAKNEWFTVNGRTYFFGPDTYAVKYTQTIQGHTYYFNGKTNAMVKGWLYWINDNTYTYYNSKGWLLTGFQTLGNYKYYFDPSDGGHMVYGLKTINGKKYLFKPSSDPKNDRAGQMLFGKQTVGEKHFYFGSSGAAEDYIEKTSSGRRLITTSGDYAKNKFYTDKNGNTYYFGSDTYAVKYEQKIGGSTYYFNGSTNIMHKGWLQWKSTQRWTYYDSKGRMLTGMHKVDGDTYYFDPDQNGYSYYGFYEDDNKNSYYFNSPERDIKDPQFAHCKGEMVFGRQVIKEKIYYFAKDGIQQTGLVKWSDGRVSYFDGLHKGAAVTKEWRTEGGNKYYFEPDGYSAQYRTKIKDDVTGVTDIYYFDKYGRQQFGLITWKSNGKRSYFDPKNGGKAVRATEKDGTKFFKVGNDTYCFDHEGISYTHRQTFGTGNMYYFNKNGVMQSGVIVWQNDGRISFFDPKQGSVASKNRWISWNGKKYYLDKNGYSVRYRQDGTIDKYFYYFNGKCQQQFGLVTWKEDGRKSYFDPKNHGRAFKNRWVSVNGTKYYMDANGYSVRYRQDGTLRTGGKKDPNFYYFNGYGQQQFGLITWKDTGRKTYFNPKNHGRASKHCWISINGTKYYMDNNGYSVRYRQKIGGHEYYFNASGEMHRGWLRWKDTGRWSYYDRNGRKLCGTHVVDGVTVHFTDKGTVAHKPMSGQKGEMFNKAQGYSSNTNMLIVIDAKDNWISVFDGHKGNWNMLHYWRCSTGAPNSPTPLGQYTVTGKGYSFGHGYTCYYYTQFWGDYLIHSVTYYENTFNVMEGAMGVHISAGCVRLPIERAHWIYSHVPLGTKVVIYR